MFRKWFFSNVWVQFYNICETTRNYEHSFLYAFSITQFVSFPNSPTSFERPTFSSLNTAFHDFFKVFFIYSDKIKPICQ